MEDLTGDSRPDLKSPEFREAARLLGSMRSEKKRLAGTRNLEKARQHLEEIRKFKRGLPMSPIDQLFTIHDYMTEQAKEIMVAKNHDYRSGTGDPYANFRGANALGINPITGILLRIQDKLCRVATFASKGQLMVKGEGVDDALLDIINYSVLIKGLIDEQRIEAVEEAGASRASWALDSRTQA